jgi:manganese efflux pump family protein
MDWAALILWVLTAGGGFVLLAMWLKAGGMSQRSSGRIRPAVILTHFGLAATGLVLWIVYVASDSSTVAMFGMWLSQRSKRDGEAAEQRFPVSIVGLHGVLAATTLVLVFLAAAGIGS